MAACVIVVDAHACTKITWCITLNIMSLTFHLLLLLLLLPLLPLLLLLSPHAQLPAIVCAAAPVVPQGVHYPGPGRSDIRPALLPQAPLSGRLPLSAATVQVDAL